MKAFTAAQVRALNYITDAEILTTSVITNQLSNNPDYWMQKLSASQLGKLTTAQLTVIVAAQFGYFSATQMGGFTAAQLPSLSLDQFKAITGTTGTGTNAASESLLSAISGITPAALITIPADHFAHISTSQLGALTTTQIPVLTTGTTGQVAKLNGLAVTESVPAALQMGVFTKDQAGSFASAIGGFFNSLSATQVNALAKDTVNGISVSRIASVPTATINNIKPSVIYGLDEVTTYSLTSLQIAELDTYPDAGASDHDQVQALKVASLKDHIIYLSTSQIGNLTSTVGSAEAFTSTNENGQIGELTYGSNSTTNQINLLSINNGSNKMADGFIVAQIHVVSLFQFEQISADAFAKFTAAKLAAFQNKNINHLSTVQFASINADNIKGFQIKNELRAYTEPVSNVYSTTEYGWIQAIPTTCINILTASQFAGLTTTQIPGFSVAQVAELRAIAVSSGVTPSSVQIQAFTYSGTSVTTGQVVGQVASLPAVFVDAFSSDQLNAFTATTQFPEVSQAAIHGLSTIQLSGLNDPHVGALTHAQLITLDSNSQQGYTSWNTFNQNGQVAALSATGITTAQLANSTSGFADDQIKNFSPSQTVKFTASQLQNVVTDTRLNNFSAGNFNSTLPLSAWQISRLNASNMGSLTTDHLKNLDTNQKVAAITVTVIGTKVSSLDTSKLTYGARTTIARTQDEQDAGAAADSSVIPQIEFMNSDQVQAITISAFTEGQVQALHIPYVTAAQIASLAKIGYLSVQGTTANALAVQNTIFSTNSSITSGFISVTDTSFSSKRSTTQGQIEQLSAAQIRGFTTTQIPKLTEVQLVDFTQQQMKFFTDQQVGYFSSTVLCDKEGVASTDANQFKSMGENLLYLPYSQYALVRDAITTGISDLQKEKETDYHVLARVQTLTDKMKSDTTLNVSTYDIKAKASYDEINAVPALLLQMLNATQVASLSVSNIGVVTAADYQEKYSRMSQEARDVLSNNILGWLTSDTKWSTLATNVNTTSYGYKPSNVAGDYKYPPVDQLSHLSDEQIGVLTAAALTNMGTSEVQINAIPDWSKISINVVNGISGIFNTTIMGALTSAHYKQLTAATIRKLSDTLFKAIPDARIADLNANGFGPNTNVTSDIYGDAFAYTAIITSTQAAKMTTAQVNALHNIGNLTDTQGNNAVAAIFSSSPTTIAVSNIIASQIQALNAKIRHIHPDAFALIVKDAFASPFSATVSITVAQAAKMTTDQLNAPLASINTLSNAAVAAAFSSSAVTVANVNPIQIKALGAKIAQIAAANFSTVNLSVFENVSAITALQAAQMTATQAGQILNGQINSLSTVDHIPNFPVATFSGFTVDQIKVMTSEQINAAPALGKRRLMLVLDGAIAALDIDLTGFNTSVLAALLSSLKQENITVGDSDATVQVKMTSANAQAAFKYAYGTDGKVRLYVDKSQFQLSYQYLNSSAVSGINTATATNSAATGANVLNWNGNVTYKSISSSVDPLTWDFIHHVAKETYGNYRFASLFTDVNTSESALNVNINTAVNSVVYPILNAFDISSSSGSIDSVAAGVSFTKKGSSGAYYTEIDPNVQTSVTGDKYNIPSTIFNNLYKEQPERFTTATTETFDPSIDNVKQSMPFMAGDTLNFLVTVTPADGQRVLDTTAGMKDGLESSSTNTSAARVKARTYKMQIVIE